jgi:tetratricopeptide (TPR) repeat protein
MTVSPAARSRFSLDGLTPDVKGTLARTPLPHLLVHALGRGLTGSMVIGADATAAVIVFAGGAPVRVDLDDEAHRLGAAAARDAVAATRVAAIARAPAETEYAFYAGKDLLTRGEPDGSFASDPLPVIATATRALTDRARIEETLAKLGDKPLTLHGAAAPERFGFEGAEKAVLDALRATPRSLGALRDALLDAKAASKEAVENVVFALVTARHVELGQPPLGTPWPPPRAQRPPRGAATADESAEVKRVLTASANAEKAEKFLHEGDYSSALPLAEEAVRLDPRSREHLVLCGYLRGLAKPTDEGLRAGIAALDEALAADPRLDQALLYRGLLRRKLGQEREALADFRQATEINPSNIAAARELRAPPGTTTTADARAPVAAPDVVAASGTKQRMVPPAVAALLALIAVLGLVSGIAYASALLRRPPAAEREVRSHLVRNAVDHALGTLHTGAYAHEEALDAMGPSGAEIATRLLRETKPANDGDARTAESFRVLANEYLVHYAQSVAKADPPAPALEIAEASANEKWEQLQKAWSDWLAKHK